MRPRCKRRLWGSFLHNTFPNPGPGGPTETLQLTYILKCWHHISNKICSFHKQKPSKLHIFSECWQHISNETFIPQVLASYIQYILKCWQHISNKICSFPKQKPSKLHIFSKCWQHIFNIFSNIGSIYPIKYIHSPNRNPQKYIISPNVGSIYPTYFQILAAYIQ